MGRFEDVRANLKRAYAATRASVRAAREDDDEDYDYDGYEPGAAVLTGQPVPVAVASPSVTSRDDAEVPHALRVAAAWSWRALVLAAAALAVLWLISRLQTVLIPLAIALLLSALLYPPVRFLRRRAKLPPSVATAMVLVGGIAAVVGILTLVVTQFVSNFPALSQNASGGVQKIQTWLQTGPLHLSSQQLTDMFTAAQDWLGQNRSILTTSALATAATTVELVASMFLVLFATFFFLRDGRRIWRFLVRFFPSRAEAPVARAGEAAWLTLVAYVRATILVAFIDAVGIGIALVVLRVPLAFPLATLVFLAAFIPIVGATVSGIVAVLVALVTKGPFTALLVLIAVIAVQQLEGHVLQPIIMGRAVSIHPLAVIVAIATGVVLAGIVGALVAVPIVAVLNTAVRHLIEHRDEPPPDAVVVHANPVGDSGVGQPA
jgi:predicted PurR-regulated permease PerM